MLRPGGVFGSGLGLNLTENGLPEARRGGHNGELRSSQRNYVLPPTPRTIPLKANSVRRCLELEHSSGHTTPPAHDLAQAHQDAQACLCNPPGTPVGTCHQPTYSLLDGATRRWLASVPIHRPPRSLVESSKMQCSPDFGPADRLHGITPAAEIHAGSSRGSIFSSPRPSINVVVCKSICICILGIALALWRIDAALCIGCRPPHPPSAPRTRHLATGNPCSCC